MSDLVPKIGLAIEGYKARQQDIIGLGHRAYKDLFSAANISVLTSVVQRLILQSYSEMVTGESPRNFLAGGCFTTTRRDYGRMPRVDEDDGNLSA